MCQAGTRQSPIDLDPETALAGYFEPLVLLNYDRKVAANITNNGHTAGGLPGVYHLDQVHFHWKSEHTLRGKRLPLEMHMVHHNKKYSSLSEAAKHHQGVAVLGVLFFSNFRPLQKLDNRRIYLQHPRDLSFELSSLSSKLTFSWFLVLVCGGLTTFSS
ncbi:hypothetical protein C0J52_06393 [Blattella germanica]|nr:hypothetical protein C0J52_06393 [Blattella germanica]